MKRFFNSTETIVTQAVAGTLRVSGNHLARAHADKYPNTKFVVRRDWDKSKVAIISGGGAGHEPLHVGFVGKGMLTAAVSGDVFASPSVTAILACILEVSGDKGCLLIVKNYTGDRINFGLAAERARLEGKKVEMLIVGDDIALPESRQPRGIAGTLFVHKAAGYLSEMDKTLEAIKKEAEQVAENTVSLGLALSTCTPPDAEPAESIESPELGLGIHGEPGVAEVVFKSGKNIGKEAVSLIVNKLADVTDEKKDYAVLINNLGIMTPLEMSIITDEVLTSHISGRIKVVVGPGLFCTSLNMYGFSLSLLELTPERKEYISADVEPHAWRPAVEPKTPQLMDISHLKLTRHFEPSEHTKRRDIITEICTVLLKSETKVELDKLDEVAGDGDTGRTYTTGALAVKEELEANKLPLDHFDSLFSAIAQILETAMGGSSGGLLAIMFTKAGASINQDKSWAESIESGIERMKEVGGAKRGYRSMIDALEPAIEERNNLKAATEAARAGAEATANMIAKVGRAAKVNPEKYLGKNDAGAEAIALVFEHLNKELK